MDGENIQQPDVVSALAAPETPPAPAIPATPPPLTPEDIDKRIAAAVESATRRLQSDKDKSIAEVRREAEKTIRRLQGEIQATDASLQSFDPSEGLSKDSIELARLRARDQAYRSSEAEDQQRQAQEYQAQQLANSLNDTLDKMGIDRTDKRVDWAADARNYYEGRSRFDASVAQILKEKGNAQEKSIEEKITARMAALEQKMRKEQGLDFVDTSQSGGVSSLGIPTDMAAFRKWIATIPQKEYEDKYADTVNKMRREGKFK